MGGGGDRQTIRTVSKTLRKWIDIHYTISSIKKYPSSLLLDWYRKNRQSGDFQSEKQSRASVNTPSLNPMTWSIFIPMGCFLFHYTLGSGTHTPTLTDFFFPYYAVTELSPTLYFIPVSSSLLFSPSQLIESWTWIGNTSFLFCFCF